jgi:hypothetical protein
MNTQFLTATDFANYDLMKALHITAPKTYAGDIKAFANFKVAPRKVFSFCKCLETSYLYLNVSVDECSKTAQVLAASRYRQPCEPTATIKRHRKTNA